MVQDRRDRTEQETGPAVAAPRVKAVACLSGVSLERGVPADQIHRDGSEREWEGARTPRNATGRGVGFRAIASPGRSAP
jgi:hypothetical protein